MTIAVRLGGRLKTTYTRVMAIMVTVAFLLCLPRTVLLREESAAGDLTVMNMARVEMMQDIMTGKMGRSMGITTRSTWRR